MRRTCWLSVDFDFFVRSLGAWDWGHQESAFFREDMWPIRLSGFIQAGIDLQKEMDPEIYARPLPQSFWSVLEQLGYDFTDTDFYVMAESHAGATPIFNQIAKDFIGEPADVVVNFDAHHDLGYCDWARIQGLLEQDKCTCDMWLCALMEQWPDLEARIVFPDWLREEYTIQQQRRSIQKILPDDIYSRVEMGFFSTKGGNVSRVVSWPREKLDVQCVFVCRSGSWVPPWLDADFIDFVMAGTRLIGQLPSDPFRHRDVSPFDIRDFDHDEAVRMAEQVTQMREQFQRSQFPSDDDE